MTAMTNHFEGVAIKAFFGDARVAQAPANWYLQVFTAAPGETGGGTPATLARTAIANSSANWDLTNGGSTDANGDGVADSGTIRNATLITLPVPTVQETVTHWGLYDAPSGGNLWVYAPLTASKVLNPGDTVTVPIGGLTYQQDN